MDQNCTERILSDNFADYIVQNELLYNFNLNADLNDLCFISGDEFTFYFVPLSNRIDSLLHEYGYIIFPRVFGLQQLESIEASGITRLRNIPTLNLNGQGVIVGFVDTGIDYTHNAFKKADGTSRIVTLWDQTIQTGPKPEGAIFQYGTEYTQEQINEALASDNPLDIVPSVDEIGHGTFLAGITAGSEDISNNFEGVVPLADIAVVKLKNAKRYLRNFYVIPDSAICYQETDIMFGVQYLIEYANRVNRPIAICIGLGTSYGGHDDRGNLSRYLSTVADRRGAAVVIAAGNEGNRSHHYSGSIPTGQTFDTVELKVGPNEYGFTMELWGGTPNTFSIDILTPSGEYVPRIPARLNESRTLQFIFEQTIIKLDYILVEAQTGNQLILLRFQKPSEGIWRFQVYANPEISSRYNIWLPIHEFISSETIFTTPDPDYTLTIPGNTTIPIVVTAYDITNDSLYLHASRGFTANNRISPSFAAPGVNLVGPSANNTYTTSSGTSLAAAFTTGVAAFFLEWGITRGNYTQLDSVEINKLLIRGARRDPNLSYPNRQWGYGILDVYNTFNLLRGEPN